jgi:hypothetical protein
MYLEILAMSLKKPETDIRFSQYELCHSKKLGYVVSKCYNAVLRGGQKSQDMASCSDWHRRANNNK